MNSGDREEFDRLISELCAGFNIPPGDRPAAFWKGLAKMSIAQFARVVEEALGESGCEKFPTVRVVWDMHRKRQSSRVFYPQKDDEKWEGDEWDDRANKRFMGYIYRTSLNAAKTYGEGGFTGSEGRPHPNTVTVHPLRAKRMEYLLRGKRSWSHEMRHCKADERTQEYADSLFAELMEAAEIQAAKEVLGDELKAVKPIRATYASGAFA